MAMPMNFDASPAPTYIIYRDAPQGELYDATAPLAFFPPKDSDELFDALRAKYPHVKSHSERMRDATIEFLLEERQAESMSATVSPAMPSLYESVTDMSPWQQSWPSASMTTLSSPDLTNFATPAFENSPKQAPQLVRQESTAAASSSGQTPAIDQMTSVFSLSTVEQPKQRVRRKMTEAEKVEYRKRRIVKACDKCSKRKRKCIHNQPEMENLKASSDSSEHKVAKPRTKLNKTTHHAKSTFPSFETQETDLGSMFTADDLTGGYEDFTLMLDEPTLDFGFEDFTSFDQPQFFTPEGNFRQCTQHFNTGPASGRSSGTSQDWTLLDHTDADNLAGHSPSFNASDSVSGLMFPHNSQLFDSPQSRRRCEPGSSRVESAPSSHVPSSNIWQTESLEDSFSPGANYSPSVLGTTRQATSAVQASSPHPLLSQTDPGALLGIRFEEESPGQNGDNASPSLARGNSHGTLATPTALDSSIPASGGNATQSTALRRHRLRSGGTANVPLQSELSSTSATSSGSNSRTENATALDGRPAASNLQSSVRRSSEIGHNASDTTLASSTLQSRTRATQDALAASATQRQSHVPSASSSALIARPSPFDETSNSLDRSPDTPALQWQSRVLSTSSSALLARPSPFDEIANSPARSTELFRLKNRIPSSLDIATPSTTSLATQANGGAYQQPEFASLGQASRAQTKSLTTTLPATTSSSSTEASDVRKTFTESDTRRFRDHHGRLSGQNATPTLPSSTTMVTFACIAVAIAVLAAIVLSTASTSGFATTSLLALALLAPTSTTLGKSSRSISSALHRQMRVRLTKQGASPNYLFMLDYAQSVCV